MAGKAAAEAAAAGIQSVRSVAEKKVEKTSGIKGKLAKPVAEKATADKAASNEAKPSPTNSVIDNFFLKDFAL